MTYSKAYGFGASDQFSRLFSPFGGSLPLWTPAEIATTGWYDSQDASTVILEGATDRITFWNDKSGFDNHLVNQNLIDGDADNFIAKYSGDINGRLCIDMDFAGNLNKTIDGNSGSPSGQATCHAAIYRNYEDAGARVLDGFPSSGPWFMGPNIGEHVIFNGTGFATGPTVAAVPIAITINSKNAANLGSIWVNGTFYESRTAAQFPTSYNVGSSGAIECAIGEIVSWNADDQETRQLVEGYLAWRWGIEATLPGGHPYKDAAPTL